MTSYDPVSRTTRVRPLRLNFKFCRCGRGDRDVELGIKEAGRTVKVDSGPSAKGDREQTSLLSVFCNTLRSEVADRSVSRLLLSPGLASAQRLTSNRPVSVVTS